MRRQHQVVIVGGGTGGIAVAARLARRRRRLDVAVVEPSPHHFYQPMWTLVGAGVVSKETTRRGEADLVPRGTTWIQDTVARFLPDDNEIETASGERIGYDQLVVAPGIELDWGAIRGLEHALGRDGVCSNYGYLECERTWQMLREFRGGTALFTMPSPPIKCAGAPQKIAYLADDHFRRAGVRDRTRLVYAAATPGIFGVGVYARTLDGVVARKGIETLYRHEFTEVRPATHEAVFQRLDADEEIVVSYDLLHVVPPQRAPAVVRHSPLADERGWVDVDRATLRHVRHPNVWSLGDASSLPTSRTGAAIRKQAPALVANLLAAIDGHTPAAAYDGYTACPLVTGYGKLVLAEFDYDLTPRPSFPIDTTRERWSMYQLKRHALPRYYWNGLMRGRG